MGSRNLRFQISPGQAGYGGQVSVAWRAGSGAGDFGPPKVGKIVDFRLAGGRRARPFAGGETLGDGGGGKALEDGDVLACADVGGSPEMLLVGGSQVLDEDVLESDAEGVAGVDLECDVAAQADVALTVHLVVQDAAAVIVGDH